MPKVSIVLPTYNGKNYIRESIDSIINQTYTDWELIIVNDCSNDGTEEIVREYEKKDYRIRVIDNEVNKKLPRSLNIGFRSATGDYLTWTSDDNMYLPNAIHKMVNYLDDKLEEVMVCALIEYISEDNVYQGISIPYSNEYMYFDGCVGACFLYRREVLQTVGEYNPDFFLVEDYEYWLRILFKYRNIGFINEVLYTYRNQSNSLTARRLEEVRYYDAKVKAKYITEIANGLRNRKDLLCQMYYKIEHFYKITNEVKELMYTHVNRYICDSNNELEKEVIVYGAGHVGSLFWNRYSDRVRFFADKDSNKVGKKLFGVEIISLDEMRNKKSEYQIVVASGIDKIYDLLCVLELLEVENYYIYKEEWWK